eukprot:2949451-Alexandrium_andersonii.AAC.1
MENRLRRSNLELRGSSQKRPQNWSSKLPRSALCTCFRADSESDDERGCSGRSEGPGKVPR